MFRPPASGGLHRLEVEEVGEILTRLHVQWDVATGGSPLPPGAVAGQPTELPGPIMVEGMGVVQGEQVGDRLEPLDRPLRGVVVLLEPDVDDLDQRREPRRGILHEQALGLRQQPDGRRDLVTLGGPPASGRQAPPGPPTPTPRSGRATNPPTPPSSSPPPTVTELVL